MLTMAAACGDRAADQPEPSPRIARLLATDSALVLVTGDTLALGEGTRAFYRSRGHRPAWVVDGVLTEAGAAVYRALGTSDEDGLDRRAYGFEAAMELRRLLRTAREQGGDSLTARAPMLATQLELVLAEGMTRLANDLAQGTVDPRESGVDWRIPREQAPEEDVLTSLAQGRSAEEVVAALRPRALQYERLRQAYARYRSLAELGTQWPTIPESAALKPGERGPTVVLLRQRLAASPDPREAELAAAGTLPPDHYDERLAQALEHFQERHSIEPDGVLGPTTIRELNIPLADRMAELRLNMDRWRWLPHQLGERYLLVNVAGFELEVVEADRAIESMNVVVGQEGWHTPVFADTMEQLVVNPYWNVPATILEEEIGPALAQDPGYLARNNMERIPNGGVRQRPGKENALGQFKFLFPNPDDIYLHDTPARELFSRTRRDFSHGCIRLERARDLADLVVTRFTSDVSTADLDQALAGGGERWIELDEKLPVYVLYFTTWVQEDGNVRFHHDVYGRDAQLEGQARRKLT